MGNFDSFLFGDIPGAAERRARLDAMVAHAITRSERMSGPAFTPAQKARLLLAGRGDIKRLLDDVEDRRRGFDLTRATAQERQVFVMELHNLRNSFDQGPFGLDPKQA